MKYMSWTFWRFDYAMKELYENGDRIYQLGMFDFITEFTYYDESLGYINKENVSGVTGRILENYDKNNTDPNNRESITVWNSYWEWIDKIRKRWPHIKWYLSIRNDGTTSAIQCLMDNVNGVKSIFLEEVARLIDKYPWCTGIDLDLEHCGGYENADNMVELIKDVSKVVHEKGKLLHYDLPAMNGEYWSVGSENWCSYSRLNPYLDSVVIMSYDFAWQGSAPGAVAPKSWLEIVYDYVSKSFDRHKVFMGLPGYGYCWQIYKQPNTSSVIEKERYRGHTMKYNELIQWQNGTISHTDTQALIPFASYIDDEEKCAYMYPHVYDIQGYDDAKLVFPATKGNYKGLEYVNTYKKNIKYSFSNKVVERTAKEYTKTTGNVILVEEEIEGEGEKTKSLYSLTSAKPTQDGEDYERVWGIAYYDFNCTGGEYELILDINFTWFDRGRITVELDGKRYSAVQGELWENETIRRHYHKVATVNLSSGAHTFKFICEDSIPNALLYGFILCSKMTKKVEGGSAKFHIEPQTLYDVNMKPVNPKKYKLTFEVLRRNPDYSYIYSDDFRSYVEDFFVCSRYYTLFGGTFSAVGDPTDSCILKQTNGSSMKTYFILRYDKFKDIYVKAQFTHKGQEVGLVLGKSKVGIKGNTIVVENDYKTDKVIKTSHVYTDKFNELAVRVRGTKALIWLNGFAIGEVNLTSNSYQAGIYSYYASYECMLFEIRDSYNMYRQECITVTTPAGVEKLGRLERSVKSNEEWSMIYVPDGVEEINTRKEEISDTWDFMHTKEFSATEPFDITINFDDIGFWLKKVLLVDSEGASVAYYNDIFSYMYWFNECINTYGFKGCGIWCTGEENPDVYKYLNREV